MLRKELAAAVPEAASGGGAPAAEATSATAAATSSKAAAALAAASDEVIYKIDIPANRYDMLCLEGIARALNVFKGREPPPAFSAAPPPLSAAGAGGGGRVRIVVKPETALIRPFIVGAVLRGVTLDPARYNSFIDLQDKLHQNLCRQRSLVAIGTHDLAKVKGRVFTYEALPPEAVTFVPLKQTRAFRTNELFAHYQANDLKLRRYVPLLQGSVVVPCVFDGDRALLSLPPLINGQQSAISLETKDVFIECTATDLTKAKVVLNTVVAMFSQYCAPKPFSYEQVEVVDAFGESHLYPDMSARELDVPLSYVNSYLGLSLGGEEVCGLLRSMQLDARVAAAGVGAGAAAAGGTSSAAANGTEKQQQTKQQDADSPALAIRVPPTRSDVLHGVDVVEDVAIAYGFNNLPTRLPSAACPGRELPVNGVTDALRAECAMSGFVEVLTWALLSRAEVYGHMRLPDPGPTAADGAVSVGNPATAEFEVCRPSLLPSLLKTLGANKDAPLPVRLFEAGDVVLADARKDVGARNERRLAAAHCGREAEFEVAHGLLNRVMEAAGVPVDSRSGVVGSEADPLAEARLPFGGGGYWWRPCDHPSFLPGRHASVMVGRGDKAVEVGRFGVLHPEVLAAYGVPNAACAMELNLEPLVFDQAGKPNMVAQF
jgi:phenylalanyl-tRNA synthetase beta chain